MSEIIKTLFGINAPPKEQVQDYRTGRAMDIGKLWGQATVNQYASPERQQAYINQQAAQSGLLSQGIQGVAGMFGVEDPMLKRQAALEGIFQQTQQDLGADASNPTLLYPAVVEKLLAGGFNREAFQVQNSIQEQSLDWSQTQSNNAYKDSLSQQALVTAEEKKTKLQGNIAYGALNAYKNAEASGDIQVKDDTWNRTMASLNKIGVDTSAFQGLPDNQRELLLKQIVDSSTNATDRSKEDMAVMKAQALADKQTQNNAIAEHKLLLGQNNLELKEQIANMQINSREQVAAQNLLSKGESDLEKILALESFKNNGEAKSKIGTKEYTRSVKAYLEDEEGLNSDQAIKGLNTYNSIYESKLNVVETDKNSPNYNRLKYTPNQAENETKKEFNKLISKTKKTFFGIGVPGTTSSKVTTKPKIIKFDKNGLPIIN